ncbi:MAG: hypothetical protein WKG00_41025 [Polyangiaceae bacterium]
MRNCWSSLALPALLSLAGACSSPIGRGFDGEDDEGETHGASGAGSAGPTEGGPAATAASGAPAGAGGGTASGSSNGGAASGAGGGGVCGNGGPPMNSACYWEEICPDASLDVLAQAYSPGVWFAVSVEMIQRRYPSAACLLSMYADDVGNYADASSFGALATSLMTMVHEETHGYDYEHALWGQTFAYWLRCDLALEVPFVDGFPRSAILAEVAGSGTDLYDGTYLTGQQGTYGFVELLDEWNAYLNGMAAIGSVGDHVDVFGISGTDGALAFAYYLELYLRVARTQEPAVWDAIAAEPALVELIRMQWNRMHFFLEVANQYDKLSIAAADIAVELYAPENLAELEMLLGVSVAAGSCN